MDLCHGQALEEQQSGTLDRGMSPYLQMIGLKTGSLFRGACRVGSILAGGSVRVEKALDRFAEHLGLAFQMKDDLLPYVSDSTASGKPKTSDVVNRRPTFPVLLGYESASNADRRDIETALSGQLPAEQAYDVLRELLHRTGALESAQGRVLAEVRAAQDALGEIPHSPSTQLLRLISEQPVEGKV
jgi:geranylgeranyl pyrophosphate synthase